MNIQLFNFNLCDNQSNVVQTLSQLSCKVQHLHSTQIDNGNVQSSNYISSHCCGFVCRVL